MSDVQQLKAKDFKSDQEVRWCPGCGDYSIINGVQAVLADIGVAKENVVMVSGIGCSSRFPYYMDTYGFHGIHGRANAIATGVKIANPVDQTDFGRLAAAEHPAVGQLEHQLEAVTEAVGRLPDPPQRRLRRPSLRGWRWRLWLRGRLPRRGSRLVVTPILGVRIDDDDLASILCPGLRRRGAERSSLPPHYSPGDISRSRSGAGLPRGPLHRLQTLH